MNWIISNKESFSSARREDLWAIWGCARNGLGLMLGDTGLELFEDWDLFEGFLDGEYNVNENENENENEDEDNDSVLKTNFE